MELIALFRRLIRHVEEHRRRQGMMLLALTIIASAAEVVSLGSLMPFMQLLASPEMDLSHGWASRLAAAVGATTRVELMLPLTLAFIAAAVVAATLRIALTKATIRFANGVGGDLSIRVYERTLHQPYPVHIARSSSEIISGITQKVATVTSVLMAVVTVSTSGVLFLAVLLALVAINPAIAAIAATGFGSGYLLIAMRTRRRQRENSLVIASAQTEVVKSLQEGLGAIRDILIDGSHAIYVGAHAVVVRRLQEATGENSYINLAPRYAMESMGIIIVAGVSYLALVRSGSAVSVLPTLAVLGLGAQRLLPLLQLIYGNWSTIVASRASLLDVLVLLEQPMAELTDRTTVKPKEFRESIELDRVTFRHAGSALVVLDRVSVRIARGSRVGIVGPTGSGKSTVLDIVMSLLEPTDGALLIDGVPLSAEERVPWRQAIAHVPQAIFLSDATLAENIAFGVPRDAIDMARVRDAGTRAQLDEFVASRPDAYEATVGERGVRLSGGQRQRIGIARALYKRAPVLVLDEATSALDNETEAEVMKSIQDLGRSVTVLIVAHRLTTLRQCDTVLRFERGRLVAQGSYSDVVGAAP